MATTSSVVSPLTTSSVRQFPKSKNTVVITGSYGELSTRVSTVVAAATLQTVGLRVGLAVGSTPSGALRALETSAQNGVADLTHCQFFVLDEFFAEPVTAAEDAALPEEAQSAAVKRATWPREKGNASNEDRAQVELIDSPHFQELHRTFLHGVSSKQIVRPEHIYAAQDFAEQVAERPLDVVIVGVGPAGEIGWTHLPDGEPLNIEALRAGSATDSALLLDIRKASTYKNQRYASCISVSFAALMRAKHVILMALSRNKAEIVRHIVTSAYEEQPSPASFLFQYHPSVQLFINDSAAALLDAPVPLGSTDDDDVFDKRILLLKSSQRFLNGERIICFSPHPDDTSISAGATLAMLAEFSNKVTSCVATTGHRAFIPNADREERTRIREREATEEAACLGADCEFLRLPLYESGRLSEEDVFIIEAYLRLKAPTAIFLPHTADTHPTHREVLRGILTALRNIFHSQQSAQLQAPSTPSLGSSPTSLPSHLLMTPPLRSSTGSATAFIECIRLFMYEGPWSLFPPGSYNCIVSPPSNTFEQKQAAIRAHKSQVDRTAYDKAADALATMRAVLVPEQDLAGFGGMPPRIEPKIELFYFYPVRSSQDVELLLSWYDERKHPVRFPALRL